MNVIFLDVDGVLNSFPYFESMKGLSTKSDYNEISDFHLQMLSKLYHDCDAKIVLASTWRDLDDPTDKSCYTMYKYLLDSLAKYGMTVFDKTPLIGGARPLEIVTWLQQCNENVNFVVLDDDYSSEEYDKYEIADHLVQTKFFCDTIDEGGLQQEHVDLAKQILGVI